jgi:hypothetical protein
MYAKSQRSQTVRTDMYHSLYHAISVLYCMNSSSHTSSGNIHEVHNKPRKSPANVSKHKGTSCGCTFALVCGARCKCYLTASYKIEVECALTMAQNYIYIYIYICLVMMCVLVLTLPSLLYCFRGTSTRSATPLPTLTRGRIAAVPAKNLCIYLMCSETKQSGQMDSQ